MRHRPHALDLPATEKMRCGEAEDYCRSLGLWPVIGTDEVGRGPLAGPVVTAAVLLCDDAQLPGLNDSKALSHAQRVTLGPMIERQALAYAVVFADVAQIDARNILGASLWAMGQAVARVQEQLRSHNAPSPAVVLVDGHMMVPGLALLQKTVVKGDSRSRAIAAASILAKLARDAYMDELEVQFPGYGFAVHKGYPVPSHLAALQALGPCPEHRRSFAPVAALLATGVGQGEAILTPTNQQTGQTGELIALKLAQRLGWEPWRTNVPIAGGEVDVVCLRTRDGKREALLLEVKTRRGGLPETERVSRGQLARLRKMAKQFAEQEEIDRIEMAVVLVALDGRSQTTRWLDVPAF